VNFQSAVQPARYQGVPAPRVVRNRAQKYIPKSIRVDTTLARSRGHDFLVAFSCKCRDVSPSCASRRMTEVSAHLVDQVLPRVPCRQ
jgi:hypothetical protein